MKKSDLAQNHHPFDEALSRYRTFIKKIINAQRVVSTTEEKRDIAESVLLRLCANWESFIENHLVDCVNCDPSKLSTYFSVTIPRNPDWNLCYALLVGRNYLDFRNFGDLKSFTKRILPGTSNPFLSISRTHSRRIDEVYKIRNYLSHYSATSRRHLMDVYRETYQMQRFLEPGQFLLAYSADRLWKYFDAFEGASKDMKKNY